MMRSASTLLLLAVLAGPAPARAESGLTAAPILVTPFAARPAGMGGAWAAGQGLDSIEYNPAGLAGMPRLGLLTSYEKGFDGGDYGLVEVGGRSGALAGAVGVLYHNAGSIALNLSDGTQKTVTALEDSSPFIAGAVRATPWLWFGGTLRMLRQVLAQQYTASSVCGDLGVRAEGPGGLAFGASLQNQGQDVRFDQARDPLPSTERVGASYTWRDTDLSDINPFSEQEGLRLTLSADYVRQKQEDGAARVGGELGIKTFGLPPILFRGGYMFGRDQEGVTVGFGYEGPVLSFDYAALPTRDLGISHLLTLRIRI